MLTTGPSVIHRSPTGYGAAMSKHRRLPDPRRTRTLRLSVATLAGAGALLAGCSAPEGTPDDDGYTGADWASELPHCAELWVEGQTLPEDYRGCTPEGGGLSVAATQTCSSGDGDLVYYDGYFARQGEEISAGDRQSAAYQQASDDCG